jgi:glycosyltransferase involved in cell wall biosynthesis
MRIVFTIHQRMNPDSGSAGVTWQLARSFRRLGHEVECLSYDDVSARIPATVRVVSFPAFVAGRLRRLVARERIDVIDASAGDSWIWAALSRRRPDASPLLVARTHGLAQVRYAELQRQHRAGDLRLNWRQRLLYPGGLRLWEVARSLRQADLTLYLNSVDREHAITRLGASADRARVTPNGVPESLIGLPFEDASHVPPDEIRIAQLGRYSLPKGVAYGAAALNRLLARHPGLRVTFLGTGGSADAVLGGFDLAVHDRIEVIPRYTRDELPHLLAGHQIKLFPTLDEGFGMALLEAMACGLAPVATATSGPREFLSDGVDALLVPPRDSAALETALERLITDRPLLERMRRAAHETAQGFSWDSIARRTLALYEEMVARKGRR